MSGNIFTGNLINTPASITSSSSRRHDPVSGHVQLLDVRTDSFALARAFVISRGAKSTAKTLTVTLGCDGFTGRGEAVPYARYGETLDGAVRSVREIAPQLTDRQGLQCLLPAGAVRNALDCAFWDLEAKRAGQRAHQLAGLTHLDAVETFYTLSLDAPDAMARHALSVPRLSCLKLKLGGGALDADRMSQVRAARPDARLVADANEAWSEASLNDLLAAAATSRFELIEQPLPANHDGALCGMAEACPSVVICGDESVHARDGLADLTDRYRAINIKLDKAGGLTEALETCHVAHSLGLKIMVGSMVCSSLGIAPAMILAQTADWVDLDSPLLLAEDRSHALAVTEDGIVPPPVAALWG
ncbi:MAG: dipeptide epimerase [Pseudomonadota bacterium]